MNDDVVFLLRFSQSASSWGSERNTSLHQLRTARAGPAPTRCRSRPRSPRRRQEWFSCVDGLGLCAEHGFHRWPPRSLQGDGFGVGWRRREPWRTRVRRTANSGRRRVSRAGTVRQAQIGCGPQQVHTRGRMGLFKAWET